MKKLFIYYSHTGNGDLVAEILKDYEIRKVETVKKLPKAFFFAMMKGGFLAAIKAKSKLLEYDKDVSEYDEIVIGSPTWNARLVPAINTVLNDIDFSGKKLDFILWSGGGTAKKSVAFINKNYPDSKVTVLKEPKKNKDELNK